MVHTKRVPYLKDGENGHSCWDALSCHCYEVNTMGHRKIYYSGMCCSVMFSLMYVVLDK